MRTVENYELVLSGEQEDRLLLTFDWSDVSSLPRMVSSVVFDEEAAVFRVTFEDASRWEEILFVDLPITLHTVVKQFDKISVVGLSDDVEVFSEVTLNIK